jgi:uncharacterized protein (DUF1778 family)
MAKKPQVKTSSLDIKFKNLGVRGTKEEHDLLSHAAELSRQSRNNFILGHALDAAKRVLAVHNLEEKDVPASKPWK